MVYSLLKEEMAREGGIHALQLRTRTIDEDARQPNETENKRPSASDVTND